METTIMYKLACILWILTGATKVGLTGLGRAVIRSPPEKCTMGWG